MNERLKQLAEQAGITTNIDTNYFEKDMNKWVDYFSEKFAELIVAECTKILADNNEFRGCVIISKHFGVEE